jgi:predicted transcriptional regulator
MKRTRETIIKILERDTTRERIFKICRDNGLTQKTAEVVDKFLDKTMEEVAEELQIDVRTVQRKINTFIEKCSH